MTDAEFRLKWFGEKPKESPPMKPQTIALDGSKGRLPCSACSSRKGVTAPGSGPHWGRINCARCGNFRSWLSADAAIALGLFEPAA